MEKTYMFVGYGKQSKRTGKPYSRAFRLHEAQDGSFGYVDEKDQYFTDDIRPLGSVIKVSMVESKK